MSGGRRTHLKVLALLCLALFLSLPRRKLNVHQQILTDKCKATRTPAGPPSSFSPASRIPAGSDRYVPGTPPILIHNAKILTGQRNGTEIVFGDILIDKGLIVAVGYIPTSLLPTNGVEIIDAKGKWITPGLVDLHSHLGVHSAPALRGSQDGNSPKAPILPWLRSVDGLNTHDDAYELAIAGGVTTAQILPGSMDNIGGQAVVIKLRKPSDRSVSSMIIEPPEGIHVVNSSVDWIPWRHMKHACGENPDRWYSQSRMDASWNFRSAYNRAREIKLSQDEFCSAVEHRNWATVEELGGEFPEDLQWESLVDVLRGKVRLSIHCYEAVDLDMIVRLSNEFRFPVASFHHAGETYLVPDVLKRAYGGAPSIALFASNARKKREAYRGSEFALSILAKHGIPVVMKSDHPVLNSRYLLYEAAQAHYYGLHPALSIASVTSTPARAAGLSHRIGTLAPGYDADLVIWDSHPLALGATPVQVFIDGIKQLSGTIEIEKGGEFQQVPKVPDWKEEIERTVEWEGLPPLRTGKKVTRRVRFVNVSSLWLDARIQIMANSTVVVDNGEVVCTLPDSCSTFSEGETVVDLDGGSIAPGLTSFGSQLGLTEILLEDSTNDGVVLDPLVTKTSPIMEDTLARAHDGLQLNGRNLLLAYRAGVTKVIVSPLSNGFLRGMSTAFRAGAVSTLDKGAILKTETALHINVTPNIPGVSVSTQIAALRKLLFAKEPRDVQWGLVRDGKVPLVVHVDSADIMSTCIALKMEYEYTRAKKLQMTFVGASEAHLIADEIAMARISVVLLQVRPFPSTWDMKRILPGPPLTNDTSLTVLLSRNITVAIGVKDEFDAKNLRFNMAWAALESNGKIDQAQAFELVSTNLEKALGLAVSTVSEPQDLVVYRGGDMFDMGSKVIAIISRREGSIDLF